MEEFDIAPFLFVRKLLSMSGIWPYLTTTQRFARVIIVSASLMAAYSVQVNIHSDKKNISQFHIIICEITMSTVENLGYKLTIDAIQNSIVRTLYGLSVYDDIYKYRLLLLSS